MSMPKDSKFIKCVTIGDGAVGKTSLLISYTTNSFTEEYEQTIFDNFSTNLILDDTYINLALWDTAGQEEYNRLRPLSYRGTDVFLLAFSLISRESYLNISDWWASELNRYAPGVPIILVGTKMDLRADNQFLVDHPPVTTAESGMTISGPFHVTKGEELKRVICAAAYIECSSKTHQNVKAVFGNQEEKQEKKGPYLCHFINRTSTR